MDIKASCLLIFLTSVHYFYSQSGYFILGFLFCYGLLRVVKRRQWRKKLQRIKAERVRRTESEKRRDIKPQSDKDQWKQHQEDKKQQNDDKPMDEKRHREERKQRHREERKHQDEKPHREERKHQDEKTSQSEKHLDKEQSQRRRKRREHALIDPRSVLMRKNINSLSSSEFERFANALEEMKNNGDYNDVASIHGEYCKHGSSGFGYFHSSYLLEFERLLQAADERLGGDGRITLPYWAWDEDASLPDRVEQLQPNGSRISGGDRISRRDPTSAIRRLQRDLPQMFRARNHQDFISLGGNFGYSLEEMHNRVHVSLSFPMSTINWAAHDICFWLHHGQCERVYRTYLDGDSSWLRNFSEGEPDEFNRSFPPLRNPITGRTYRPADYVNMEDYPRVYDVAYDPPNRSRSLQISPVTVVFDECDIMKFNGICYIVHIFVCDKDGDIKLPDNPDEYFEHNNHGGFTAIFGKGKDCAGCLTRPKFKICVDIQDALIRLGLSRYNIKLVIKAVEVSKLNGGIYDAKDIPLPEPRIVYDLFEDKDRTMENGDVRGDVGQLQKWLIKYGYYSGDLDDTFGPKTEEAVKKVKEMTGYKDRTGVVDKDFLDYILRKRCDNKDVGEQAGAWIRPQVQQTTNLTLAEYLKDKVLTYYVDDKNMPLIKGGIDKDIKRALEVYAFELGFTVEKTLDRNTADVKFVWELKDSTEYQSDGKGGVLAYGIPSDMTIYMDAAERWSTTDTNNGDINSPIVFVVVVHEASHVFGMVHSNRTDGVTSPYYNVENIKLLPAEKERLRKLYV